MPRRLEHLAYRALLLVFCGAGVLLGLSGIGLNGGAVQRGATKLPDWFAGAVILIASLAGIAWVLFRYPRYREED